MVTLLTNPKKFEGTKILKINMHTKCLITECKKGCLIIFNGAFLLEVLS